MNCKETQENIPLFLEGKLELQQLNLFLEHIESCKVCKEELEVYYTFYAAIKILEEDSDCKPNSCEIDLRKELARAKEKLKQAKRKKMQKSLLLYIFIIIIGIFMI